MVTTKFRFLLLASILPLVAVVIAQDDLEVRVTDLEGDVLQINSDVNVLELDVSQNTGQIFEVINDVDDIDELNVVQEQRLETLEQENSALLTRLADLEQIVSVLSGNVQAIDNSTAERLNALEGDVTTLENDVTGLESDVSAVEDSVEALDESTDLRLAILEANNVDYSHTAFFATFEEHIILTYNPVKWDTAILNPGGHYSTSRGIYTVPVDGIYQFVLHYRAFSDNLSGGYLVVDDVEVAISYASDPNYNTVYADLVVTLSLTSGQEVWIDGYSLADMYGSDDGVAISWFSGHLIYPL